MLDLNHGTEAWKYSTGRTIDLNQWRTDEQKEIDYKAINALCVQNAKVILEHWQPGGKLVGHEYICAMIMGGEGSSCSTNIHGGQGSDFGTGESWGDMIDLVAQIENVPMKEAALRLQDFLSAGSVAPRPVPSIPRQTLEERYEAGKNIALGLWAESEICPHNHPYLVKKGVNADGIIRIHPPTGNILIPLSDERGTTWSVQRIFPGGDKKINHCGKLTGNFYIIGGERDVVYIAEGYATAMTVAIVTGKTVVMAVSAGNLAPVAEKISVMFPASQIIFAADNDQDKDPNPGVKAATDARNKISRGTLTIPPFPPGEKGDWNDFAIIHGGKAARELLLSNKRSQVFVDIKTLVLVEPQFLVDDVIETPCTGMVFGPSGGGKSFFVLDMGFHIACGKKWLGKKVKQGPVFYVCGEGRHAIPRRMKAWEEYHKTEIPYGKFMMSGARVDFSPESVRDMVIEIDSLNDSVGPPAVIMIDTMARALPGDADENSSKDVGAFIDECDRLQQKYNCVVLIVHHTGHAENARTRARGSSAIKGAMDVEMLVTKDGTIEWTKTKDMEPHPTIKFELVKVQYGENKWDNSCVLKYDLDYNSKAARNETAYRKAARKALHEAAEAEGGGKCRSNAWAECCARLIPGKEMKDVRRILFRKEIGEVQKMIDAGEVDFDGTYYIPIINQTKVTELMFKEMV